MSDDINAAQTGGEGNAAPVDDKRTALAGGDPPAGGDNGAAPPAGGEPAPWRDDWREAMAGDDAVLLRQLKRFTKPENLAKSYHEIYKLSRNGQSAPELADDATPEEITAYRKSVGVPEKPEDYGFAFPETAGATEADNAALGTFAQFLHDRHIAKNDPGAKAAFEYYLHRMAEARVERAEAEDADTIENLAKIRSEFTPNELKRNQTIAEEFLDQHFGEDQDTRRALHEVLHLRLPSGVAVKDYAPFVKGLFSMALAYADESTLIAGDRAGGGGQSLEERKKALVDKSIAGTLTKDEDAELNRIYEKLTDPGVRRTMRAA